MQQPLRATFPAAIAKHHEAPGGHSSGVACHADVQLENPVRLGFELYVRRRPALTQRGEDACHPSLGLGASKTLDHLVDGPPAAFTAARSQQLGGSGVQIDDEAVDVGHDHAVARGFEHVAAGDRLHVQKLVATDRGHYAE